MNCKIVNDIVGCAKMFGGGIYPIVYLYDFDTTNIVYDGDLNIKEINGQYTLLKGAEWTYAMDIKDNAYQHKLSGSIVLDALEEFYNAENQSFIIVFAEKNGDYKCFGDQFGAKLSFSQDITNEKSEISVSFGELSDSVLKVVDATNFVRDRIYHVKLNDVNWVCEAASNGYKFPQYQTYTNYQGEPLDRDGRLVSITGNKQAAYKATSAPDGDYDIVDTYVGEDKHVYDAINCPNTTTGSISVSPGVINLDTTGNPTAMLEIVSDNNWSVLNKDEIKTFTLSAYNGIQGTMRITVYNGLGGTERIEFINVETREVVTVIVNSYVINVKETYEMDGSDRMISIPVTCNGTITATTESDVVSLDVSDNVIYVSLVESPTVDTNVWIKVKHNDWPDEEKDVLVKVKAIAEDAPHWVLVSEYCLEE